MPERKIMRRVAGFHDIRLDGMTDLLMRAAGAAVMDIGCNRGLVGLEFAGNGARLVHGCDNYAQGIEAAREIFADLRCCDSQFEIADLSAGPSSLAPFRGTQYDIVTCLATYHKLKRVMSAADLTALMQQFGVQTKSYFGWRGTSDKPAENEQEMVALDRDLGSVGLKRIHTSYISRELGVAAIWGRVRDANI